MSAEVREPAGQGSAGSERGESLIQLESVSASVPAASSGRRTLFAGLDLTVRSGETVAIVGKSGSGKTTLLSILGLMLPSESGRYLLKGVDVTSVSESRSARLRNEMLGFVFQSGALLHDLSCAENVELPLIYGSPVGQRPRKTAVHSALEAVGLAEFADVAPNRLSGGEQQRIAIARAMVRKAPVILADEPTGSLDPKTSSSILKLLVAHVEKTQSCLVVVTHEPEVAMQMHRCLLLVGGQLREIDPAHMKETFA